MDDERRRNAAAIPWILAFTVLVVAGQLLLKSGLSTFGEINSLGALMSRILVIVIHPYVFLGLALYVFSTGLWLIILSRTSLSFCYPFISISYVLIIITSRIFFREIIDFYKVTAIILIIVGVIMLSLSRTGKSEPSLEAEITD
jgi:drug/metabolite transporter (DMT)-like permease